MGRVCVIGLNGVKVGVKESSKRIKFVFKMIVRYLGFWEIIEICSVMISVFFGEMVWISFGENEENV